MPPNPQHTQTKYTPNTILKHKQQLETQNELQIYTVNKNTLTQYLKITKQTHLIHKQTKQTNKYNKFKNETKLKKPEIKQKQKLKTKPVKNCEDSSIGKPGWSTHVDRLGWAPKCHTIPARDTELVWTLGRALKCHHFPRSHRGEGTEVPHLRPDNIQELPSTHPMKENKQIQTEQPKQTNTQKHTNTKTKQTQQTHTQTQATISTNRNEGNKNTHNKTAPHNMDR